MELVAANPDPVAVAKAGKRAGTVPERRYPEASVLNHAHM